MVINVHPPALLKLKFLDEKLTITKISGLNKLCRFVYACTYYEQTSCPVPFFPPQCQKKKGGLGSEIIRVTDCISKHVPIQGVYCYILTPCVEC